MSDSLGESFPQYLTQVLPSLFQLLETSHDPNTSRNCAYAAGQFVVKAPETMKPFINQIVQACIKIASEMSNSEIKAKEIAGSDASQEDIDSAREDVEGAHDNAISALGKCILYAPTSIDLTTVLPAFTSGLPLKNDFEEAIAVTEVIEKLLTTFSTENPSVTIDSAALFSSLLSSAVIPSSTTSARSVIFTTVDRLVSTVPTLSTQYHALSESQRTEYENAKQKHQQEQAQQTAPATKQAWN